jgi:flagellar basal body L-ring protein FlgH
MSGEESFVIVSGIARPTDINRSNTIRSDRLADLSITLEGKGDNERSSRKSIIGWLFGWLF